MMKAFTFSLYLLNTVRVDVYRNITIILEMYIFFSLNVVMKKIKVSPELIPIQQILEQNG